MPTVTELLRLVKAGGISAAKRAVREADHNHVHVISTSPPVVYMWWGRNDQALHVALRDLPLVVLYLFPWCAEPAEFPQIAQQIKSTLTKFPKHRITFLCNEEYCVELLNNLGIEALFVNQNAFVNENVFRPKAIAKTHDAIYSASLAPYKRHHLAKDIQSLIVLSYSYSGTSPTEYQVRTRKDLAHAWWAKDSLSDDQKISTEGMVDLYNQARVGLCLSAVEGAMFASMEYLLCGMPIVTTKSRGGRAAFWNENFVITAADEPKSISKSVQELVERNILPDTIREQTLLKVEAHRNRLRTYICELGASIELPWSPGTHGVTSWSNLRVLGKSLRSLN